MITFKSSVACLLSPLDQNYILNIFFFIKLDSVTIMLYSIHWHWEFHKKRVE